MDSMRVATLLQLSELYLDLPEPSRHFNDTALLMASQARELSSKLQLRTAYENASIIIGRAYLANEDSLHFPQLLKGLKDTTVIKLLLLRSAHERPASAGESLGDANRALAISESIHSIRWKIASLIEQGSVLFRQHELRKAAQLLQQAFAFSTGKKYLQGQVDAYVAVSRYFSMDTTLASMMKEFEKRIVLDYRQIQISQEKVVAENAISDGYVSAVLHLWDQNNTTMCMEILQTAVEFGRHCIHPHIAPYYNIVYLYLYRGDFKSALSLALESLRLVEKTGNPERDERPYMSVGKVYSDMHKGALSIEYYKTAMQLIRQKGFLVNGMLLRMVTEAYVVNKQPEKALPGLLDYLRHISYSRVDRQFVLEGIGFCYFILKRYDLAEPYLLEEIKLVEKGSNLTDRYNAYEVIGKVYAQQKKYHQARYYFNQVLRNDTSADLAILKSTAHRVLYYTDSCDGKYLSAMQHLAMYTAYNDSIYNSTHIKAIEELKTQYETDKKDRDIVFGKQSIQLLQKQGLLQRADLERTRYLRNGLIGGTVMLILLLAAVYNRYRTKNEHNRELEKQQKEIQAKNAELNQLSISQEKLLAEKEWLIKEVHHRVKNNLQLVISLLNMQEDFQHDIGSQHAFLEISRRISAISLIHQKLYLADDLATINMQEYTRELIQYLTESRLSKHPIRFEVSVDRIELEASQSVSIGLILNEAITNSIKYAFGDAANNKISISMVRMEDGSIILTIADNGKGVEGDFDIARQDSMGMGLIKILSEQLEGNLEFINLHGLTIRLSFKPKIVEGIKDIEVGTSELSTGSLSKT